MMQIPIDALCINCGSKFHEVPKQSFFGFQKLTCPHCQQEFIYPLTAEYRLVYWTIFTSITLLIINALSRNLTVSFIGWGCIGGIVLMLIADILCKYRVFQAGAFFTRLDEFDHDAEDESANGMSAPHKDSQNSNDAEFEHEIYRIIEEYQQGLMAKAIKEAQGQQDMVQNVYVQFKHYELTNKLEEQCNMNIERKLRKLAKKPQSPFETAAEQNHVFAEYRQNWLGGIMAIGLIVLAMASIDEPSPSANAIVQQTAKKKPVSAPTAAEIVADYRKQAEQGNVNAQFKLGMMYKEGQGVKKDPAEALRWLRNAAQGLAQAQFDLGRGYETGQGVNKDDKQAMLWYRRAAEQGHTEAQLMLGNMYAEGRGGLAEDKAQALVWYQKAATQGNAVAQVRVGEAYSRGLSGLPEDDTQAVVWYRKAAEQGNAEGQNNLGSMYEVGRGVAKDEKQAAVWYRKAAEQGNAEGQNNLATLYFYGQGLTKDEKQAVVWYQKAAEQGLVEAQLNLGNLYAEGIGVDKDKAQAATWYFKAAEQGDDEAKEALRDLTD